jgi:peroxiredoxin family protein
MSPAARATTTKKAAKAPAKTPAGPAATAAAAATRAATSVARVASRASAKAPAKAPAGRTAKPRVEAEKPKKLVIIAYSGELEKTWATMILASTAGAMAMETSVFVTFWGLQTFVKDKKRITGENWMQKMMSFMQRPGVSHRKLSKMNFMGMGPWMMFKLAKRYNVSKPKELLEMAQALGVKFYPCQMTLDMFGLKRDDLIEGMEEPVGAAFALQLMSEAETSLFV